MDGRMSRLVAQIIYLLEDGIDPDELISDVQEVVWEWQDGLVNQPSDDDDDGGSAA